MKISIGSDHAGFELKSFLIKHLKDLNYEVIDVGTFTKESCDYPDFAKIVAENVSKGITERGILICGTGIGMCIAANKFKDIRAALCFDVQMARLTSEHNKSNIICLSGKKDLNTVLEMVKVWIDTPFTGGRHQRRIDKIKNLENTND